MRASGYAWKTDLEAAPLGTILIIPGLSWMMKSRQGVWVSTTGREYPEDLQEAFFPFYLFYGYRLLYR